MLIDFIDTDSGFTFSDHVKCSKWLLEIINREKKTLKSLQFFFISESDIVEINSTHLNHNYPTDIITFNYGSNYTIEGDIYICPSVVDENSKLYSNSNLTIELYRVIVHGLLHLMGYNDKTVIEQEVMRKKENECLTYIALK